MDYGLLPDEILSKLLIASDERAFEQIYFRHSASIFTLALKATRSREAAQEITQTIFVSLWRNRETTTIKSLIHYLHGALQRQVFKYIRAQIAKKTHQENLRHSTREEDNSMQEQLSFQELTNAFEKAIELLPDKTRTIFRLSRQSTLSVAEIASRMNMSEKAVEYHITKSIKSMRLVLKDYIAYTAILGLIDQNYF